MKNAPQQIKFSLRIAAVTCIFAWLFASVACSFESIGSHSHGGAFEHPDTHHDSAAVAHAHAAADHSDDSDGDKAHNDDSCCSSLKSAQQGIQSTIISKPSFALAWLHTLYAVEASRLARPAASAFRQGPPDDWVFTPEVCLGPAFRSLAPPVSS